jgi:hypothetical protein
MKKNEGNEKLSKEKLRELYEILAGSGLDVTDCVWVGYNLTAMYLAQENDDSTRRGLCQEVVNEIRKVQLADWKNVKTIADK